MPRASPARAVRIENTGAIGAGPEKCGFRRLFSGVPGDWGVGESALVDKWVYRRHREQGLLDD
ncbi:MAG: hypothetical protein IJI88_06270 [Atopobiaceae bacterium]|nr:hypothetical protein [Atopobiaceae bacterium]